MDNEISQDKEVKPFAYNTYVLMNKPVYFWGFTSYQLLGCFGPIFLIAMICFGVFHAMIGSIILTIMLVPVFYIMGKIRKQNSKGNPDYLASYFLAKKAPCVITDRDNAMEKIYKNQAREYKKHITVKHTK